MSRFLTFYSNISHFIHAECKEGEIRLTNGSHAYEGTVEVCLDNTWCLVAQHGWDDADARVVCKQIGGYNYSGNDIFPKPFLWYDIFPKPLLWYDIFLKPLE